MAGFLNSGATANPQTLMALSEMGYVEGRNVVIEVRSKSNTMNFRLARPYPSPRSGCTLGVPFFALRTCTRPASSST